MKKLSLAITLVALIVAGAGFVVYEAGDAQHRQSAPPQQPGQSQPAPPAQPAQPRDGHTAPPPAPKTGQASPRPPEARNEPERPRRGPERGPVVIPYPGWPIWGYPSPWGYPPYGGWRVYGDWDTASVRLDVSPKDAQVYVDGYYAGVVDEFDGLFQHLTLHAGPHLVEIRKTGYTALAVELNLYPGESITYRRTMAPAGAESPAPAPGPPSEPGFEEGAAPPLPESLMQPPGSIRFDVTPKDAAVYVDGFYAGIADDFSGSQRLQLAPGRHHVRLDIAGYRTIDFDVLIESTRSITYRASLERRSGQ